MGFKVITLRRDDGGFHPLLLTVQRRAPGDNNTFTQLWLICLANSIGWRPFQSRLTACLCL